MDTTALGETAARLMDDLAEDFEEDCKLGVVLVIAEIDREDDGEFPVVQFRCSDGRLWVQDGLLYHALNSDTEKRGNDGEEEA